MLRKNLHITSLLALIISVSLSISTVHFHQSVEHQGAPDTEMATSISVDTNYCPICGYLFQTPVNLGLGSEISFIYTDDIPVEQHIYLANKHVKALRGRSPPALN